MELWVYFYLKKEAKSLFSNNNSFGAMPMLLLWVRLILLDLISLGRILLKWVALVEILVWIWESKLLPKLNIYGTPIANKYFEGKLKNTLVRGWNRVWKFMDSKANDREFFVKKI